MQSVRGTEAQDENCSDDTGDDVTVGPEDRDKSVSATDYFVSGSEENDDGEMSSSSGDDEDSSEATIVSARQWILLDVDPVKPPRFPFLAIPGKTFNLSLPDDITEHIQQFLDDELITSGRRNQSPSS
ncbi:hypothetical protein HPB50_002462 [Hyalomma asiaticum]|uniref:Uncharacterized protein n=1 Tax=Hyalomma asiaticum TaxID=266040 RepID=A0ACB7S3K9_HYAAI|nr:hypothetical protein HPB50_002462 [Hyalomma asiaticum]